MRFVSVTCFTESGEKAHLSFRLTKTGQVHLGDVNRFLRGTPYKVPLRYLSFGVRKRNPDVGWPEDVLFRGEPPEEYADIDPCTLQELREQIIQHSPAKMTPEEKHALGVLFQDRGKGTAAQQKVWMEDRQRILDGIAARPYNPDEW